MRGILFTLLLIFSGLSLVLGQVTPVAYTGAGTQYVQNFDGLPATGSFTLTGKGPFNLSSSPINAASLSGWQIFMNSGSNPSASFSVGTGSSTGNGVYSLGVTATAERALGSLSSSTGIYSFGLVITNQTGGLLNSFTVTFTAEQWRKGGSAVKNIWTCRYKTGNISQMDQTELTDEPNLSFGSVITTSGGTALNGNLPENRQLITYTVNGILWKPGEQLLVRWDDADEAGSDDAVGMDNFSFSAALVSSAPVINNISATAITANTTQLTSNVNENYAATTVFFEYDTSALLNTKKIVHGNPDTIKAGLGNTNVNASISGLTPGTIYYYRIKTNNSNGTVLSGIQNFTTAISLPTVITGEVFSVTTNSAVISGNVTELGGAAVTEKGIIWSVNNTPTVTDNKIICGIGSGSFTQLVNGLPEGVILYARAYAINAGGIAYGAIIKLITQTTISQFMSLGNIRTNAATISFTFKTAKNINGLSTANFTLQASGISGASISSITGSGTTYTITLNTGAGDGKIRLIFSNDSGLTVPISNKPFTSDNSFIIDKTPPQILGISIPDKPMLVNDTVIATIMVNADTDTFKIVNGTASGFTLSGFTKKNDSSYTALFIIPNGGKDIDASAGIPVTLSLIDSIGNQSGVFKDSIRQSQDQIDANRPFILSIKNPQKGIYKTGDTLSFIFRFSEKIIIANAITCSLGITVGTRSRTCSYVTGSGTDSLQFRYIVSPGDLDKDGVKTASSIATANGLIKDFAGNTAVNSFSNTLATKEVLIDGVAPIINNITAPLAGVYRTGNFIDFMVNFSKKIYVDESASTPALLMSIGSKQKTAYYMSGSGSNSLLFRYSIQIDDVDTNGIKLVSPMIDSSLSVKDSIGNKAVLTLSNIGSLLGVKINPPTTFIESVLVPPAGIYKGGDTLDILVNYNEKVWVTTDKGIPSLKIIIGSTSKQALYNDGSGGNTLFFSYVIQPGDEDIDGIQLNNFISLNGGIIKNENGYNVPLVLNNVGNTSNLLVDGIAPSIKTLTLPTGRTYKTGDTLDFIFRFSEKIMAEPGIAASTLSLTIGSKNTIAKYADGNTSDSLVYRYIIQPNDFDKDGIKISSPITLLNTTIKDRNGNIGDLSFSIPSTKNILIDAVAPVINTVTSPVPGIYTTGNILDIVCTYTKKVYLINNTVPLIALKIGNTIKNAFYSKGAGTNSLVFSYRVEADDMDSSGMQIIFPENDFSSLVKDTLGNFSTQNTVNSRSIIGLYINPPASFISRFSIPVGGVYKAGDTLQFQATFNEPILVSSKNGNPGILLTSNTGIRQASCTNGSGTNILIFKYIIQKGDADYDGIEIDSILFLNNGSIRNSKGVDANVRISNPINKTEILIDGIPPFIKQMVSPANGIYKNGDCLDFVFRFSEKITYAGGSPSLPLTIGSKTKTAVCISGDGTDSLVFRYKLVSGDFDMDGIKTGNLSLNNASIKDFAGNNASLVLTTAITTNKILIDAVTPTINSISVPSAGIYTTNDSLNFSLGFSKNVFLTPGDSSAHILIQIGNTLKEAVYIKGSGNKNLQFGYRIQSDDLDTNGININQILKDVNYSMRDSAGNTVDPQINPGIKIPVILINPPPLTITDIMYPSKMTYITGDTLPFKITFSENVIVSTKNGTPYLSVKMGALNKKASYTSGSGSSVLFFRYIIQSGDEDLDGIELDTALTLNNASIRNAKSMDAFIGIQHLIHNTEIVIDGVSPVIKQFRFPTNGIYKAGDSLDFVVRFSENIFFMNGTPSLPIAIGTKTKTAVYISGNGTDSLLFRYRIANGDFDMVGIKPGNLSLNNSSIKDWAGNMAIVSTNNAVLTKDILVDAIAPVINNVSIPVSGNYKTGDSLNLMITFSEKVWVTENINRPSINCQIGSLLKEFSYLSGSGSNALSFRYIIQTEDLDTNGIQINSVVNDPNDQIKDSAGNHALLLITKVSSSSAIKINPPLISSIKQVQFPSSGVYKTGDSLKFIIQFSDAVSVSINNGVPYIKCTIGSTAKQARYISGSGTENIYFLYVIQTGDLDQDGVTISNNITLNGAEIKNGKGNTALLSFIVPTVKNILVDGVKPIITGISTPAPNVYKSGNILDFLVSFSEKIVISGSGNPPSLPIIIGNMTRAAVYINGSGSDKLLFRYVIQVDDIDNDGIKLSSPLNSNEVSMMDAAGNLAILTLGIMPNTSGIIVNPAIITVNSILLPSKKTYKSADTLDFILNYSEPAFVNTNTGVPSLKILIGSSTKQAVYISGSGTNYLLFRYLIQNGDLDTNGIKLASSLSINNGSIKDARGNNAPIILPETANTLSIKIDAVSPAINNIISNSTGTYKAGDTLNFQIGFSEPVFLSNTEDTISLAISIGNFTKTMFSEKGSGKDKLSFRYLIQSGDLDKNGITIGNTLLIQNSNLTDLAGNKAITSIKSNTVFPGILVDAVSPVFLSSKPDTIALCENSTSIKIHSVLSVTDSETAEALFWKIKNDPLLGSLSARTQTANSNGKTVACPLIEYKPFNHLSGTDSLLIEVSDGINSSQKRILLIIQPGILNNSIGYPKTICTDQTPGLLSGSAPFGGNGQYQFIWQFSSGIDSVNFTYAPGNYKNTEYTPPLLSNNSWFRRHVQSGECRDTSTPIKITVLKNGVWTGTNSSDWNNSSNWCGNSVPDKNMDVLININTLYEPQIRDTVWCNRLTISNTTHLKIDGVLNIQHSINALEHAIDAGNGTIIFSGTNAQNISGKLFQHETIHNLIIQNPSGVNISDSLTINGTVLIQSGYLNTNNMLTLLNKASIGPSATGTAINGIVYAEKRIDGGRRVYQILGNPFKESLPLTILKDSIDITGDKGSANGFTNTITNQPSAFWFDSFNGNDSTGLETGWKPFTNTNGIGENAWQTMQGIRLLTRGKPGQGIDGTPAGNGLNGTYLPEPATIKLNGHIHSGDVELTLQKYAYPTYQILANPYISNIDLSYLTKGKDIANNFWVWNPQQGLQGGYTSFPFRSKYILPSVGSFIAKTNGNQFNTILFTENMKTNEAFVNSMELSDMNEIFHIELRLQTDSIFWDRLLLLQIDSAKIFYDRNDAEKLWNNDVNFYSLSKDNKQLSIDARPFNNESTIPIGLQTEHSSTFTIKIAKSNLPPTNTLKLHDKYLDKWMPLLYDSSYTFTTTADTSSYGNERFEIASIKKQESIVAQKQKLTSSVYPVPAKDKVLLQFSALESGNTTVKILTVSGTLIHSIPLGVQKQGQINIPLGNLLNGIYLVEIQCGNEIIYQKIIKE